MTQRIFAARTDGQQPSTVGRFFAGLAIINIAGAVACWIIATKYPEESFSAALWGLGSVIGYLMISIQAMHVLAPAQNGVSSTVGTVATGILLANMTCWMLGLVFSMGASDGDALLKDFQAISGGIWSWAWGLFS